MKYTRSTAALPVGRIRLFAALRGLALAAGLTILPAAALAETETPLWEQENRPCRILSIGNSFSAQIEDGFPAAAKAIGKPVDFLHCKVGASTLQNHSDNLDTLGYYTMVVRFTTSAGSTGNPFGTAKGNATAANWSTTKILQALDWDVVTLQQRSITSSDVNSYDPYLGILVAKIRELCPTAKIYFHQTWTFDRYGPAPWGKEWCGDVAKRDAFYDGINNAVSTMVAKYSLAGVIPVGYATQLFRYRKPVISQADDFCSNDHQHFNGSSLKYYEPSAVGKYLQALVFAGALLGEVPTCAQFSSQSSDAELARECAVDACAATDYSNYGQGTYDFSWSVKFKNGDAEISSLSVTNGAAATVPNTSELSGPSGKVFSGWSGQKTKRVANNNVTTEQVQYTSAQVSTDPVYDNIVWTAVWGTTEDEPAVEPGGDEPGGDEPGGGDEPAPAEGQTILSTTPTDYGYTRQVQVGADVYTVKAYTNTRTEGWELTIPDGVTSIDYLVVGGGGSGGNRYGGGGGAGGMITGTVSNAATDYTIFVGKGGQATSTGTSGSMGVSGDASILQSGSAVVITAKGGGGGAYTSHAGLNGGSGGGGSYDTKAGGTADLGSSSGEGVTGQRYANGGGKGSSDNTTVGSGGGGGGAGGVGANSSTDAATSGKGGDGKLSAITGESIYYAGGGGAGFFKLTTGAKGGLGGGGHGGGANSKNDGTGGTAGTNGTDGLGGGGGGSGSYGLASGAGGSGIVVVRYLNPNATVSLTDATVELFPAAAEYTVSAQSISLVSLTLANGTFIHANTLAKGTDYTISPENVGPNCGTYIVTVTGQGRYSDSATTTFEIYMATPTLSGSVVQPGWTQGQTPPAPENTLSTTYGTVVVRYYEDDACTQAFTPSAATEPGTYYVRGEVDASDNWYKAVTDPEPFIVSAATPGPDDPTPGSDTVTTNAMSNSSWGYEIHGLGVSGNEVALVFTNADANANMFWTVPPGVTSIRYLVVGGGGAGGSSGNNNGGGGGGAGGVVEKSGVEVPEGALVTIEVGAGGMGATGNTQGAWGTGSKLTVGEKVVVSALPGAGGGKGATNGSGSADTCACGGGGGGGTEGQGNKTGGTGAVSNGGIGYNGRGGGGGGAGGGEDGDGVDSANGGTGGVGVATTIFGGTELRIAGGGSGAPSARGLNASVDGGGAGGHRHASYGGADATDGTTWGAGGGGGRLLSPSGSGHQGVVVIRYSTAAPTPITDAEVTFTPASYTYVAEDLVKPTVTVVVGGVTLTSSDYDVSWNPSTLRYANDYTATITGKGSYTGTKTATFYVDAATITAVNLESSSVPYDGQPHTPVVMSVTANGKTLTLDQDDGCKWTVAYKRGDEVTDDFTSVGEIKVEVTGNTSLTGTASAIFTIAKAAATITGLKITSWTTGETPQSPTCTVTPSGANVTYKYYTDAGCTAETGKPTTEVGDYWVRAFVAEGKNWSAAETPVESAVQFRVRPVGEIKIEVPVPDPVSKPYTGELQLSGLGETTYYTVSNPADAVNAGEYVVTLTLKDPLKYRFANGGEGSTTVPFTITRAENYWIANPQLEPTYWYVGDTVALAPGEAKFGEATKTITWYDKSGAVIGTGADAMPTAVGEYTLKIAVPADADPGNWSALEYAIGFIIYEPLGVTKVGVPVLPDKEYTGATQTADIPDSPLWTVTANAGGVDVDTYTAKLQLKDKTKYTWLKADGTTTTADQTITWHITKAKNRWTTEPKVYLTSDTKKAAIYSCALNAAVTVDNGKPAFGSVTKNGSITVSTADTYLLKFTVTGNDNYEGLTYELAFQVGPTSPGTEGTGTVTYEWKRNASGLWTLPDMWTASQSDVGYPYSMTAGRAIAKFDTLSKKLSSTATDYPVEVHFNEDLPFGGLVTTANAASDITINGHRFESGTVSSGHHLRYFGCGSNADTGPALSSLTVGNGRLTLMDAQYDFSYGGSSVASGSTLCLFNTKHEKRSTVNTSTFGTFEFRVDATLTLNGTARLEADDVTSYVKTLVGDNAWSMALCNQSVMRLNVFRDATKSATYSKYYDRGWRLDIDNSLLLAKNLALGCGTSGTFCDDPQISVWGKHGELFATENLRLGSDVTLARPLTVNITYPGGPFSWGDFVWSYQDVNSADLKVGAPIGAGQSLTVGSNVKFVIDVTTWAAAETNLVTVPICCANVSRDEKAYYLNVPGASNGKLTDNSALQAWYASNFTVVGVEKAAWELRYDEASRTLQLRRKGAWSYEDDFAGFVWAEGVNGRWADNARWDLGRVPNSAKNYARFLGTSSYPGYTLGQQIAVDLESQDWEIQLLDLSESVNLMLKNGGLTVNENNDGSQSVQIRPGSTFKLDNVRLTQKNQLTRLFFPTGGGQTLELANSALIGTTGGWRMETDGYGGDSANNLVYLHDKSSATFLSLGMRGSNGRLRVEDSNVTINGLEAQNLSIEATGASTVLKVNAWQGRSYNQPYRWDISESWLAADGATITLPQGTGNLQMFPAQGGNGGMKDRAKMANQLFVASNGVINAGTFYLSDARVHKTAGNDYSFVPENCENNVLRIYGKDGAFRASGSVYLGYNGTQAGAPELAFGLPSQGWEKAPLSAVGTLELRSSLLLKVDARAVKVTTKFPLASAATLTAANVASTIYDTTKTGNLGANVAITLPDDKTLATCPCALSIEDNTLYLTVEAGEKTSVPVPVIEPKVWNGEKQVADIEDCDEYTVEQNEGGSNAGSYDVVLKLVDPDLYLWDDDLGDSVERTLTFQITPAQNEWTTKPGVNPPWWNVGNTGTLTAGVAKYGAVSVTHSDNWDGSTMPTTEGSYWIRYAVAENANYSALAERVNFNVYPQGHAPTGDPDDAGYVYTWKYNGAGYWTVPDNWLPEKGATFGYPSCNTAADPATYAVAKFIAQYYDSALTVVAPGDVTTGTIWFDQGAKPVTIDMGGHTLTLVDGVNVTGVNGYGFANGTFGLQTVAFRANGTTLKVQSGTANVSALTFASQEGAATQGATIEADAGGVFAYAGDLSLGTSATTGAGTTLVLAGGQVTATGTLSFGTSTGLDAPSSIAITGASDSDVVLASVGAMTIGTTSYVANESPTVAITFPAGGFATAPIRTTGSGKVLTVKAGTKLALDVSKLEVGTYEIARATGTLTADPTALTANAAFTVRRGTKAVLVTSADGKALCVKVSSLGLTLTLVPSEVICDGSSWKERFTKTVTDSDGNVVAGATFEYRIKGGEWASDLTDSEWTNPGEIRVRATVEGYANSPTATFTIKSRGLILFFGPAPAE